MSLSNVDYSEVTVLLRRQVRQKFAVCLENGYTTGKYFEVPRIAQITWSYSSLFMRLAYCDISAYDGIIVDLGGTADLRC